MTRAKKEATGEQPVASPDQVAAESPAGAAEPPRDGEEAAKRPARRAPRGGRRRKPAAAEDAGAAAAGKPVAADTPEAPAPARARRPRRTAAAAVEGAAAEPAEIAPAAAPAEAPAPRPRRVRKPAAPALATETAQPDAPAAEESAPAPQAAPRPRRRRAPSRRPAEVAATPSGEGQMIAVAPAAEAAPVAAPASESLPVPASTAASEAQPAAAMDGAAAAPQEAGASGDEAQPAKRRRRGHRGGRRRSRSGGVPSAEVAAEGTPATAETGGAPVVSVTVPALEAGTESALPVVAQTPSLPVAGAPATQAAGEGAPSAEAGEQPQETAPAAGPRRRRARRPRTGAETPAGLAEQAAGGVAPAAAEPAAETSPQAPAEGETAEPAPRRRRGGRRRTKAAETALGAQAEGEPPASEPAAAEQPAASPRSRRRDIRRPKAIVRQEEGAAPPPAPAEEAPRRLGIVAAQPQHKVILVSDDGRELRVALIEDERLAEIYIERPEKKSYLGDIYQGKVESVLNGIDAAFVDFGLEKNGFLYVDDVVNAEGERRARRIADALKPGEQVLVQVTKDPMGSKGARLTTKISLAGRYLVYVPGSSGIGVSRRLRQGERERLRDLSKELKPKKAALIIRTLAEGHGLEDLKRDMTYLSRLWTRLKKKAETVSPPGLVHQEADVSLEVARDLFNDTVDALIVDDAKRHKALLTFLNKVAPELTSRVELYTGEAPLFESYAVEEQITRALERRVPLPSGGNLMIDHAEALTVIDVNTGRFTRGKGLEDTITKTNLEAAREAVRQLRLRDIGGIIIIDFIDMAHAKNREAVLETLEAELETDRTKTYVVELSPLGLVEMTRQNTTDGARGIMTRSCPCCSGKARVLSEETMALNVERRIRNLARRSQAQAWLFEVNGGVAERLAGDRLKRLEKQVGRRIFFEGGGSLPVDSFRVLAEGTPQHVQAQRVPVREGQEVDVELEFSLSYSPRDAVGYVDGYMVVVEGGRPFLGETKKVRITATARTGGQGTLVKTG